MKKYFYSLLARQVGLHVLKDDPVWEVSPRSVLLANALQGLGVDKYSKVDEISELPAQEGRSFILLNGNVHPTPDIQRLVA